MPDADKFLELYQLAYRNKFHPDYGAFDQVSPFDWQARVVRAWLGTLRAFETHRLDSGFDGWNDYCRASLGKGQSGNLPRHLAITLRDFGARELLTRPGRSLRYTPRTTHQRAAAAAQRVRLPARPLPRKRPGRDASDQLRYA